MLRVGVGCSLIVRFRFRIMVTVMSRVGVGCSLTVRFRVRIMVRLRVGYG